VDSVLLNNTDKGEGHWGTTRGSDQGYHHRIMTMANHTLLLHILERYRDPPKFVATIETSYTKKVCVIKIEKEVVEILQSVGV
jgi:hypothetical protein